MTRLSLVIQRVHSENKCSTFAMDIHKSKLMVQELQKFKVLTIHFSLVFFTILNKISSTMFHLDGKWNKDFISELAKVLENGASKKKMWH
jgi:hypothetical protein